VIDHNAVCNDESFLSDEQRDAVETRFKDDRTRGCMYVFPLPTIARRLFVESQRVFLFAELIH
jgi:hypothetical protein